ncbi:hypothetical protein [Garciella nitratireducens]|uniref:Uncharacterized protein n=1 Tax=Garciella nitratireducens DSM 15102 TaxID=1121911 RepID=A0A1T4KKQ1_9FIRM|nr:hypothetical protein [Garciella nitratireducens]RBP41595.1 hypothetical protein DFR81_11068 [Garciella nitratireducens]SJZ42943.1 hypothetical protein SAMN02745973_00580 [Garciella nitratireducens DSM 15102]
MTNNMKNTMLIGSTIGVSAIATYSMYKRSKNNRKPLNKMLNRISKTAGNMF